MKRLLPILMSACAAICLLAAPPGVAKAADETGLTIDELLERVRSGWRAEKAENERREQEFRAPP